VEIEDSARKHGISDADMLHAARHATRQVVQDDDRTLLIGADHSGRMLEVVVAGIESDDPRIIHADNLRPKFYRYLGKG
jgi:hypothetical protein